MNGYEDKINIFKNIIMKNEGFKNTVYTDSTGHLTIGYGHNLKNRPISHNVASIMLQEDILWFLPRLSEAIPFFNELNDARQAVLVDMAYNLGLQGLLAFKKMLDSCSKGDYENASNEILKSKYADQVKYRAKENAYIMKIGGL